MRATTTRATTTAPGDGATPLSSPRLPGTGWPRALLPAGLLSCAVGAAAQPQEAVRNFAAPRGDLSACAVNPGVPARPLLETAAEPGAIYIDADDVSIAEKGVSRLRGNVNIRRDAQQLRADDVLYDHSGDSAALRGEIDFWDDALYLRSDGGDLDLERRSGLFANADYYLYNTRARGRADRLFIDVGEVTEGKNMDFTTCDPPRPGWDIDSDVWKVSARELRLNHETDRGTGKHVLLTIKKIPVFYSPYMSFPLSDARKTGFLTPFFGASTNGGAELHTPFYWNIAPNFDATLTPRMITDRGLMAMGEFRYLTKTMRGGLNLEYLPDDEVFGRDRSLIQFGHRQRLPGRGRLRLGYNRVSDLRYFEDLSAHLGLSSQRFLSRHADIDYSGRHWSLTTRLRDYQTVDQTLAATSKPYKQLPRVRFNYRPPVGRRGVNLRLNSEVVYFDRRGEVGAGFNITGMRADFFPTLRFPYRGEGAYFVPAVGLRYTQYSLQGAGALFKSSPSRVLPVVSVNSGLFLDRYTNLFNRPYLHTLEPRLRYLYVPDKSQSHLPVFDTGVYNISYNSLFARDRFTGADRMGDTNEFTAALTSRLIDRATGKETGFFRIAQSYYLADRDVIRHRVSGDQVVADGAAFTDSYSPVFAELRATFVKDWIFALEWHWQPKHGATEKFGARAQYRPPGDKVFNFRYRVRRSAAGELRRNLTDIDQTDMSLHWPLGRKWSVVGRWIFAVSERRSLEMFGGLEYNSCCFAVRAVGRRFLTNIDGEFNRGVFLQFELKGLAGLGRKTADFLQHSIPGYKGGF